MGGCFRIGPWLVEPGLNTISGKGKTHHLEPKVMEVLVCLAKHPGESLPKEKLLHDVWPKTFVNDDALTRCIFELRRVFEDQATKPHIIQTIPKRGYRLIAPVAGAKEGEGQQALDSREITSVKIAKSKFALLACLGIALVILVLGAFLVGGVRDRLLGRSTSPRIQSLAVFPLENLSSDPKQEYLSDGITDALITDLAQIGSLKVISRTSSRHYKQTNKAPPEIARELNVDGIVEGTVQRSGDRVRITTQLVYAPSDKYLWANAYEGDLRDLFTLEKEVADDIAHRVQASLATQNHAIQPHRLNLEALEAYLEGKYYLTRGDSGPRDTNLRKAEGYFQQAISADPTFASAYIGLADSHLYLWWPSSEDLRIVKVSAEKAVELAPGSADARVELGEAKFEDWDWAGAEEEYRRAVALNPNNAMAHDSLGHLRDVLGEIDEAWKEHELAQQLNSNAGGNFWPREHEDYLSDALRRRGQFDRAVGLLQKMSERRPEDAAIRWFLSENYLRSGRYGEWVKELGESMALFGFPEISDHLRRAFDKSGYHGTLRQWASELERLAANRQGYFPGIIAETHAALGDKDRAFYWLKQGCEHHRMAISDPVLFFVKLDAGFAPLRNDPRFKDILHCMGLPP